MQFLKRAITPPLARSANSLLDRWNKTGRSSGSSPALARSGTVYLPVLILVQSRFISRVVLASCALMV